jgi:hypothetical protein
VADSAGLLKHPDSRKPRISRGFCISSASNCHQETLAAGVIGCRKRRHYSTESSTQLTRPSLAGSESVPRPAARIQRPGALAGVLLVRPFAAGAPRRLTSTRRPAPKAFSNSGATFLLLRGRLQPLLAPQEALQFSLQAGEDRPRLVRVRLLLQDCPRTADHLPPAPLLVGLPGVMASQPAEQVRVVAVHVRKEGRHFCKLLAAGEQLLDRPLLRGNPPAGCCDAPVPFRVGGCVGNKLPLRLWPGPGGRGSGSRRPATRPPGGPAAGRRGSASAWEDSNRRQVPSLQWDGRPKAS